MSVQMTATQWRTWVRKFWPNNYLELRAQVYANGKLLVDPTGETTIGPGLDGNASIVVTEGYVHRLDMPGNDVQVVPMLRKWLQEQRMTRVSLTVHAEDLVKLPAVLKAAGIRFLA